MRPRTSARALDACFRSVAIVIAAAVFEPAVRAIAAPAPVAAPAAAAPAPDLAAPAGAVTEVKVERIRPRREKHPTLRFLKENRDFIRARYDLLKEKPIHRQGAADAIDPRFLAYQRMLSEILAANDSLAAAEEARARRELFTSVTELGRLEEQLDLMERLLAEQRTRLGVLQADFTGRQQTALAIVVSGYPHDAAVSALTLRLDGGATIAVPLSPEQCESLRHGGMLQVFHGLVEPREQVVEVALGGDGWPAQDAGFVTLDPERDRLTLLRLDLSPAQPARGASSMLASTWLHDAGLHASDGPPSQP
jgi:hypothetical protein